MFWKFRSMISCSIAFGTCEVQQVMGGGSRIELPFIAGKRGWGTEVLAKALYPL